MILPGSMRFALITLFIIVTVAETGPPTFVFEDITKESGLLGPLSGMMGHSAAWGDIDKDGLPDLFVGGFCDRPNSDYAPAVRPVPTQIFRNVGAGKFILEKNAAVEFYGRSTSAIFADLNQDEFPELCVANNTLKKPNREGELQAKAQLLPSMLFQNQDGKFKDISIESGALKQSIHGARSIGILDYNGDALLDLLIIQDKFQKSEATSSSILLKNNGNLKFQDVTVEAGIPNDLFGLGVAIADLNGDSKPDFFVSHSNRMFLSTPSNKYREATEIERVFQWNALDNEDWPCGVAFGDLNRDTLLDLVITAHHNPARNRLFINKGMKNQMPQFEDVTSKVGFAESVPAKAPHVELQDFDNDGWMDIYISAAWKEDGKVIPLIYRNQGIQQNGLPLFSPTRPVKSPMIYFPSGPTADFNLDGKVDIFLVNWFAGETSHLFVNRTNGGNWIQVRAPIGSKIRLTSAGNIIGYQQLYIGYGSASGQLPICHFGVGDLKQVDLEISLPGGAIKKLDAVTVNNRVEF